MSKNTQHITLIVLCLSVCYMSLGLWLIDCWCASVIPVQFPHLGGRACHGRPHHQFVIVACYPVQQYLVQQ